MPRLKVYFGGGMEDGYLLTVPAQLIFARTKLAVSSIPHSIAKVSCSALLSAIAASLQFTA